MYQALLDGVGHLAGGDQQRLVNELLANEVRGARSRSGCSGGGVPGADAALADYDFRISNEHLGRVKVEALCDNPGHVRLPDEDDEIVVRALAVHTIAAGAVHLVTYDAGMSLRVKWANLPVLKLRTDASTGPEPEKG